MTTQNPREIAVRVLEQRSLHQLFVEDLLDRELAAEALAPADRGLLQELTFGVVRWEATLDWLITRKTTPRPQKPVLQILLRLGLYQIFWLDRIPDHAAVDQTVTLARRFGFGPQAGFVNAVLRGCLRERDELVRALADLRESEPAIGYSHPHWLYRRWESRWGREQAIKLLEWNNQTPPVFARINTLRTSAEQLQTQWAQEGVEAEPIAVDWAPDQVVRLLRHPPLARLDSFREGKFYIQDPSTLMAVQLLNAQAGEIILDQCAAPGGKATYLAQRMEDQGRIIAEDNASERLERLKENIARMGTKAVEVALSPQSTTETSAHLFDRILLDAPCSNTGVMRRRVELRWRVRETEVHRLAAIQLELLTQAAGRLKPGGSLVYSTCSLEPEENQQVVAKFLETHPRFELEVERELWPFLHGTDGAYAARLRKSGNWRDSNS